MTTAHLTRLRTSPTSPDAAHDRLDVQSLHRRILSLAPSHLGPSPRKTAGILYRAEHDHHGHHTLLIQSTHPLDLDALPIGYTTATDQRDLTPLLTWCHPHATIRYRLDAHPTRSTSTHETDAQGRRTRGRRTPLHHDDALTWWHHQAHTAGLHLHPHTTHATTQPRLTGHKPDPHTPDKTHRFAIHVTRFEGTATITDPHALRTAITHGIGRARAYGTGLLSITPHT